MYDNELCLVRVHCFNKQWLVTRHEHMSCMYYVAGHNLISLYLIIFLKIGYTWRTYWAHVRFLRRVVRIYLTLYFS